MDTGPSQRLGVKEAAEYLGISVDAVRKRLQRGQLESEKDDNGRIWVWVDSGPGHDQDNYQTDQTALLDAKDETINELRKQVALLRQEIERRGEETIRKDHIIMSLTQRIPAIESPAVDAEDVVEPRDSVLTDSEAHRNGAVPQDAAEEKIKPSWWRRFFGF